MNIEQICRIFAQLDIMVHNKVKTTQDVEKTLKDIFYEFGRYFEFLKSQQEMKGNYKDVLKKIDPGSLNFK